jgi:hypothetical protein
VNTGDDTDQMPAATAVKGCPEAFTERVAGRWR